MSEAQKKWELHFEKSNYQDINYNREMFAVRDYKAALRREIDREKAEALLSKNYSPKTLQTLDKVLELLDTVEP